MYLKRLRRRWYALHDLPDDVQEALRKRRFKQSLRTEDESEAKRKAAALDVRWQTEIRAARELSMIEPNVTPTEVRLANDETIRVWLYPSGRISFKDVVSGSAVTISRAGFDELKRRLIP